ncbi:Protein CBR-SRJ-5 [Caenorhabditis briggsae]|uniref:Protein CBR-SRJ-5 n=1 Tax=Caenorhabditis briggsae TaxID=6238 RepID=A8XRY0_CAEBR|nr:Protein CBR-SRJ-5 [Caenorhabditis briggsae]CAP35469.2 Protein CBR-SRJ-5 [Caenorhabditis briggsae]
MIYVNWYHHNVPKILAIFSFIINPLFIYLVLTKSRSQMGNYRFLLIGFAVFDMVYSMAELLTPIAVLNSGYGFVTFITDGPFFENLEYGLHGVSSRCCFVSMSYAVLIIHFVYRYLILFYPHHVDKMLKPLGIMAMTLFFLTHGAFWTWICEECLAPNEEIRDIIRPSFLEVHHVNSDYISLLTGQYRLDWYIFLNRIPMYCMTVYFVLGYKIMKKMNESQAMSNISITLNRQLFKALVAQTCIPMFASFLPTIIAWYAPIFLINLTWWNNYVCNICLSAFPLIDPIVVIYFIPNYKNTVLVWLRLRKQKVVTTTISMVSAPTM